MPEPLPPGTRVRHYGSSLPREISKGTATVAFGYQLGQRVWYRVLLDDGGGLCDWAADATIPIPPERPLWHWRFDHSS